MKKEITKEQINQQSITQGKKDMGIRNMKTKRIKASIISVLLVLSMLATAIPFQAFAGTAPSNAEIKAAMVQDEANLQGVTLTGYYIGNYGGSSANHYFTLIDEEGGGVTSKKMAQGKLTGMGTDTYDYRNYYRLNNQSDFTTGDNYYWLSVECRTNSPDNIDMYWLAKPNDTGTKKDYGYDLVNYAVQAKSSTDWVTIKILLDKNKTYENICNIAVGQSGYKNDGTMTTEWRNFKAEKVTGSDTTVNVDSASTNMGVIAQQGDATPTSSISLGNLKVNQTISKPLCALPKAGYQFDGWYIGNTLLSKDSIYSSYKNEQNTNNPTTITAKFSATGQGSDNDTVAMNEYLKDPDHPMDYEFAFMKNNTFGSDWDIRSVFSRDKELLAPEILWQKAGAYAELTTPIYIDEDGKSILLEDVFFNPYGEGYAKLEYLIDGKVVLTNDKSLSALECGNHFFDYKLRATGATTKGVHSLTIRYSLLKDMYTTTNDDINKYLWWNNSRYASVRHISTAKQSGNSWTKELSMAKTSYLAGETIEPSATAKYGTVVYTYYKDGKELSTMPKTYGNYTVTASATTTNGYDGLEESDPIAFSIARKPSTASIAYYASKPQYYVAETHTFMDKISATSNRGTYYSNDDVHWMYSTDNGKTWTEYTGTDADPVNNVGHYLVKLIIDETDTYEAVTSNTLELDILPIVMVPKYSSGSPVTATSKEYDGTTDIEAEISAITYSGNFTKPPLEKDSDFPKIVSATFNAISADAGTTKFKITKVVLDNPNYTFYEGYYDLEYEKEGLITKSTNSITSQALDTNFDYAKPLNHGVTSKFGGPITFTYLADNNGVKGEELSTAPTAVGNYWVKATTQETTNYSSDASAFTRFSIVAGTPDITITPKESIVYDGNAIEPEKDFEVEIGGTTGDITSYEYCVKGTDSWSETAPTDAGDYQVRVSVAADDNYIGATSDPVDISIAKIKLTPEIDFVNDKVYDKTGAAFGMLTLDGDIVSGEQPVAAGTFVFDDVNVGKNKTVSVSDITLFDGKNYELTATSLSNVDTSAKITECPITISGITANDKDYDGDKDAVLDFTNVVFGGIIDGDSLTVSATGEFSDKNAEENKIVSISDLELAGDSIDNYELAGENQQEEATATISPKNVTISGTSVDATKEYDGNTVAKITDDGVLSDNFDGGNLVIKEGNANYSDKTVATAKTVTFTDFELDGSEKDNYNLTAQPANVNADITAKELTVNVAVKDKLFDDNNIATFDGNPSLVGVVEGDTVNLTNGTPTFASTTVGSDININITAFSIGGADAQNYSLTQPTGITASVKSYLVEAGTEYSVNSNNWQNEDFVITAKDGYLLSKTNTANGTWTDSFTQSEETDNGVLEFYVKNTSIGAISDKVTETYKIDKTNPTGAISIGNNTWYSFLNTITFKNFFNETQTVSIEPNDALSGVAKTEYVESAKELTLAEVKALNSWSEGKSTKVTIDDAKHFVYYARITDNAGNVTYLSTDGAVYDTTNPEISGITDESTYYTTQKFTATDTNLNKVTVNGTEVTLPATLDGNTNKTYVIKATDKAGNETKYTVTMKTISSLATSIDEITSSNVKSSDKTNIQTVKTNTLAVDTANATDGEKAALNSVTDKCSTLLTKIDNTLAEISRNTNAVNAYSLNSVKSSDKDSIGTLIANIDTLSESGNVTETEKTSLAGVKETANGLLEKISATATEMERITNAVNAYNLETVKSSDKNDIDTLIADINALCDADNITDDEKFSLAGVKETANGLLEKISATAAEMERITSAVNAYDLSKVKSSDRSDIEKLIEDTDTILATTNLTEDEITSINETVLTANKLLSKVDDAFNASEKQNIKNVKGINKNNVKLSDKKALISAKSALESAINTYEGNYTDKELSALNLKLKTVNDALSAIGNAEKVIESIKNLPNSSAVNAGDRADINAAKDAYDALSKNEKAMIESKYTEKLNDDIKAVEELKNTKSPQTGSTYNMLSAGLVLLFLSGSTAEILKLTKKRKKETE